MYSSAFLLCIKSSKLTYLPFESFMYHLTRLDLMITILFFNSYVQNTVLEKIHYSYYNLLSAVYIFSSSLYLILVPNSMLFPFNPLQPPPPAGGRVNSFKFPRFRLSTFASPAGIFWDDQTPKTSREHVEKDPLLAEHD